MFCKDNEAITVKAIIEEYKQQFGIPTQGPSYVFPCGCKNAVKGPIWPFYWHCACGQKWSETNIKEVKE